MKMDVLQSISYVKAKTLTDAKAQMLSEMKDAVDKVNLIKAGKRMLIMQKIF